MTYFDYLNTENRAVSGGSHYGPIIDSASASHAFVEVADLRLHFDHRKHVRIGCIYACDPKMPGLFHLCSQTSLNQSKSITELIDNSIGTLHFLPQNAPDASPGSAVIKMDAAGTHSMVVGTGILGNNRNKCVIPSVLEIGQAIGWSIRMQLGGTGTVMSDTLAGWKMRVGAAQMVVAAYNAEGHEGIEWAKEFPNWLLRYYGRLMDLTPFSIGTSNDEMAEAITKQVWEFLQRNYHPVASKDLMCGSEPSHYKGHEMVEMEPVFIEKDGDMYFQSPSDNESVLHLSSAIPDMEIMVHYDNSLMSSALSSVQSINTKAASLLSAAMSDGRRQVHRAKLLVSQAQQSVDKAVKDRDAAREMASRIRKISEPSEAITGDVLHVCGRKFKRGIGGGPDPIPGYVIDAWGASLQGFGHKESESCEYDAGDLLDSIIHDRAIRLVGPPGTGKTSVVQELAAQLDVPYYVITCHRDLPDEQFFGCYQIIDGEQVWVDGEFTQAMRCDAPLAFCAIEEGDHLDATKQSKMHAPLNGDPFMPGNGESIPVPAGMCFIMTANTSGHGDHTGRHASAMTSDTAFNSRFKSTMHVDHMKPEDEQALLVVQGLDPEEATRLVAFANASRSGGSDVDANSMQEPVCLRHTLAYARMRGRGVNARKAFGMSIIGQLSHYDRKPCNELALSFLPDVF